MSHTTNSERFPLIFVFYQMCVFLSMDAYVPALPMIASHLNSASDLAQLTATTWLLGGFFAQFFVGPIADHYGRRVTLFCGGILFVVTSVACALAPSIYFLLVARFFQGMTVPTMMVAGYSTVNVMYNREHAIRVLAQMGSIAILAPALGPMLGSAIILFVSWHWTFAGLAIWAIIVLSLLFRVMPETVPPENRHHAFNLKKVWLGYFSLLKNGTYLRNLASMVLLFCSMIPWMMVGPFVVIDKLGLSALIFGALQTLVFGSFILGMRLVNRYMNNNNIPRFIRVGLSFALAGAIGQVVIAWFTPEFLAGFIISMMVMSLGVGLCFPILNRLTIESSDAPMGQRVALISAGQMCAAATASSVASFAGDDSFMSVAVVSISCAVIAFVLKFTKH